MSLKLVTPGTAQTTRTKACALFAFRLIRTAQSKVAQVPGALVEARNDIASAWRESADSLPNA